MEEKKSTEAEKASVKKSPAKKRNIPTKELDFLDLVKAVSKQWATHKKPELEWVTPSNLAAELGIYEANLGQKMRVGNERPQLTARLKELDKKMEGALSYVKNYIQDQYDKKTAPSFYLEFGMKHSDKHYRFPKDQSARTQSLQDMVAAIKKHKFEDKKFGLAFWEGIQKDYALILNDTKSIDGNVSKKVGDKNLTKQHLKKILNSLILAIKANKPDTYKEELRLWGFQKEKY